MCSNVRSQAWLVMRCALLIRLGAGLLWLAGCELEKGTAEVAAVQVDGGTPAETGASTEVRLDAGPAGRDALRANPVDAQTVMVLDGGAATGALAVSDGGGDSAAAEAPCENRLESFVEPPATLAETGLYQDFAAKRIADDMRVYKPQFELWSDGAEKTRWLYLPECGPPIDSSNMDNWSFPVGAMAFKEFGFEGVRVETRLVHRFGPGSDDFVYAHYRWDEDQQHATLIDGTTPKEILRQPLGYDYEIPGPDTCVACHGDEGGEEGGLPSRFLGISAVQLGHGGAGLTLRSLSLEGLLSRPRSAGYSVPGPPRRQAVLGYLHANCGHCHNDSPDRVWFPAERFSFQLMVVDTLVDNTATYWTNVGVPVRGYQGSCSYRVYPGDPERSCVIERMAVRSVDGARQMPPLATHRVDEVGLQLVRDWVAELAPAP